MKRIIYMLLDWLFNWGNRGYKNYVVLQDAYGSVRGYFKNERRLMWYVKANNMYDYSIGVSDNE